MLQLCSVRLVREANNIGSVVDQTDLIIFSIAELLNGTNIETAAFTSAYFLTQSLTAGNNSDLTKIQKFLALSEQLCALLLQFLTVDDHDNRRRTNFRNMRTTQRQLPCKESHGIGLAATGSTKICTTLTALLNNRLDNALLQKAGSKELRIPANNFLLVAVIFAILEVDVIPEDFQESCRRINALDHGLGFLKRQRRNLISIVYTAPGIEMLIRCANSAQPCLHTVRNASQRAVMQQMRDIAPIADIDLLPGIIDGSVGICRILQLNYAQRHAVDKQNDIRTAVFLLTVVDVFHGELIDYPEKVILRVFKIDQLDHLRQTRLRRKLNAIYHPAIDFVQHGKVSFRTHKTHVVHDLPYFISLQIRIGLGQKLLHIVQIQNLPLGTAGNAVSGKIVPALILQK